MITGKDTIHIVLLCILILAGWVAYTSKIANSADDVATISISEAGRQRLEKMILSIKGDTLTSFASLINKRITIPKIVLAYSQYACVSCKEKAFEYFDKLQHELNNTNYYIVSVDTVRRMDSLKVNSNVERLIDTEGLLSQQLGHADLPAILYLDKEDVVQSIYFPIIYVEDEYYREQFVAAMSYNQILCMKIICRSRRRSQCPGPFLWDRVESR
jgi:hypothetical protein